ncbi:unnamed protein product, partial [Musa acuminata var. zebrina]
NYQKVSPLFVKVETKCELSWRRACSQQSVNELYRIWQLTSGMHYCSKKATCLLFFGKNYFAEERTSSLPTPATLLKTPRLLSH